MKTIENKGPERIYRKNLTIPQNDFIYFTHGSGVNIGKDNSGRISLSFRYNPDLVAKVKSLPCHKWHPEEKYWSFPDTNGTLEKILKAFEGEEIQIDPSLQTQLPHPVTSNKGQVYTGVS